MSLLFPYPPHFNAAPCSPVATCTARPVSHSDMNTFTADVTLTGTALGTLPHRLILSARWCEQPCFTDGEAGLVSPLDHSLHVAIPCHLMKNNLSSSLTNKAPSFLLSHSLPVAPNMKSLTLLVNNSLLPLPIPLSHPDLHVWDALPFSFCLFESCLILCPSSQ